MCIPLCNATETYGSTKTSIKMQITPEALDHCSLFLCEFQLERFHVFGDLILKDEVPTEQCHGYFSVSLLISQDHIQNVPCQC